MVGRSCSGLVENVGKDAKCGLEIGDEVWLAANFYETGPNICFRLDNLRQLISNRASFATCGCSRVKVTKQNFKTSTLNWNIRVRTGCPENQF